MPCRVSRQTVAAFALVWVHARRIQLFRIVGGNPQRRSRERGAALRRIFGPEQRDGRMGEAQLVAGMLPEPVLPVRVDDAPHLGSTVVIAGERSLLDDIFRDDPPQAAAARRFRPRLQHELLPLQRIGGTVDIDIEPKRQEMVVVDRHQIRRDQHAGLRVVRGRGVGHAARRDPLHHVDAGCAGLDADDRGFGQHPIDDVVVIAEALDRPQHELDRRLPGMGRVGPLRVAPHRCAGLALEQTDHRFAGKRRAAAVGQHRVEKRRPGWAVDAGFQLRSHKAKIILADIEPGAERPVRVRVHIGHEHLGKGAAVQHHAVALTVAVLHQRYDQAAAPVEAVMERPLPPPDQAILDADMSASEGLRRRPHRLHCRLPRGALEDVGFAADRDRAAVDNPDYAALIEIDHRVKPLDRPGPDILRAGGVEAGYTNQTPPFLRWVVAAIARRQWRAEQLLRFDCGVAALLHCRPPSRIGRGDALRVL